MISKQIVFCLALGVLCLQAKSVSATVQMAELRYESKFTEPGSSHTEEFTLGIILTLYSEIGETPAGPQHAYVYETELGALVSKIKLEKTKTEPISKDTFVVACEKAKQGLIKTVYKGHIGVMRMINGYTIYWNHLELHDPMVNIDPTEIVDGVTLKAQVPDPGEKLISTPSFSNLINPNQCADGLNRLNIGLANDQADGSLHFIKVSNGLSSKMMESGGLEKMPIARSQVEDRPLGEVKLNWDKKNNTVEINGGSPGKYLAVAEIKSQDNSTCSSQVLFIFNFK